MGVEFGVLGDIEVRIDAHPVDVGHARQRWVLAVLLVETGRAVSADQLVERVWGDQAPHRARETLYSYLSRLRHALDPLPGVALTRQAGGYALTVDPLTVDMHRFQHLVTQARTAPDNDQALALFEQALALWRGEPFAGLDTSWLNAQRTRLEQHRFAVQLDCTDLQLRRGHHGWLLGEITIRAQTHPLNERVAEQLMRALYHSGRQADALDCFQQLRVRLAEDLGIDPSPGLQRLYEQILTTDPTLTTPGRAVLESAPPSVPRQLPAHTPHFVGRTAELRQLTTLLATTAVGGGTVVITAINGTAGIGKTALALHWAHHAAERFPDGQLYVNLRGFDPTNTPLHPADALRGFLDALGVPSQRVPADLDAQTGLYRSLLSDRRMLIVLDNARDAEQVRPLLPASPSCLVLITSRNQLTSLAAHHGGRPLTLDLLTTDEARTLLARHLGSDRVSAEPEAVTDLITHCAGLPLALAIVAARASTHPGFELRVLAKELADAHTRLDALDTGEATTSIRAVFSCSYQHLSAPAARMFRLIGLHPGPDIALPAATQLADLPSHQARDVFAELTRAHLLTQHTPGRYTFHDLLRAYATHLATAHDPETDRRTALTRLFDHYLHTAAAAMHTLYPTDHQPDISARATATGLVADPATAQQWLDAERANLIASIAHAATYGWYTHVTQLVDILITTLLVNGHHRDGLTICTHARHVAHLTGDRAGEANALNTLGTLYWQQGNYQQARSHHQHALGLCREIGDRAGEAGALHSLGILYWQQGYYQQAIDHYQHALTISREIGYRIGEALALTYLGIVCWRQGNYQQASDHHQHALAICREIGYRIGEAQSLTNLGLVCCQQGNHQHAIDHYQHALAICRETGFQVFEAITSTSLGIVYCQQGHYQHATDHHQHALALFRETGYPFGEAFALTNLGVVYCQQGRYQQAAECHQQALAISRDIDFRAVEPVVLSNLGTAFQHQGHYQQAAEHHQLALDLCREIGDRASEAQILKGLGETYYTTGQLGEARTQHAAALTLAIELGDRYEQARAHDGIAHTHHSTGDLDQARHHWHQALTLYTDLGVPGAEVVRAHLSALDQIP